MVCPLCNSLNLIHRECTYRNCGLSACTEEQCTDAREALERQILSRVYRSAMYPNDEVDIMRDQVLHEHMKRLARTLTPDHKDLKISRVSYFYRSLLQLTFFRPFNLFFFRLTI